MKPIKLLCTALILAATLSAADLVTWNANPPEDQVTIYKVYYTTNATNLPPKPWALLVTVGGTSATNLLSGRFAYYVVASNAYGESDPSDVVFRPGKPDNPHVK